MTPRSSASWSSPRTQTTSTSAPRARSRCWTDAGIEVTYCLVTDGDAGGFDDSVPRAEMAPLRRKEQTAAAACVGVHDLRFLGYPDGQGGADPGAAQGPGPGDPAGPPGPAGVPVPRAQLPAARDQPPGPPRGGLGGAGRGLPGRPQPVRLPGTAPDEGLEPWTVREVWISRGRPRTRQSLRGHHGHVQPQDRRAQGAREPDRAAGGPGGLPARPAGQHGRAGPARGPPGRDIPGPRHRPERQSAAR